MKPLMPLLISLVLAGCLSAQIDVQYDDKMQPIGCHASYWSLARDVDGASFNVCGSKASAQKSASAEVVSQVVEGAVRAVLK